MQPEKAADEAETLLGGGFKAIKLRLGSRHFGRGSAYHASLSGVVSLTMSSIMVDYNQALSVAELIVRGRALQHEGIYWLEEPTRHDDYGAMRLSRANSTLPLQIGENFNGPSCHARGT